MKLFSAILCLLASAALAVPRFAPARSLPSASSKQQHEQALLKIPRGGAALKSGGPLDPHFLAKHVFIPIALAQGFFMNAGPKLFLESYGIKGMMNDKLTQFVTQQLGMGILSHGLMLYCMIYKKASVYTAFRIACIAWFYNNGRALLSGQLDPLVSDTSGMLMSLAMPIICNYAMTTDFAKPVLLVSTALWGVIALVTIVNPVAGMKLWKVHTSRLNNATVLCIKTLGYSLLTLSVFPASVVLLDATPIQGMGYGCLVWIANHFFHLVLGDAKKAGVDQGSQVFWLIFHSVLSAAALLKK